MAADQLLLPSFLILTHYSPRQDSLSHAAPAQFSKTSLVKNFGQNSSENPSELYQLDPLLHDLLAPSAELHAVRKAGIPSTKAMATVPVLIQLSSK